MVFTYLWSLSLSLSSSSSSSSSISPWCFASVEFKLVDHALYAYLLHPVNMYCYCSHQKKVIACFVTCCNDKYFITDEYDFIVKWVLNSHNFCVSLLTTARWFIASIITMLVAIGVFKMQYALTRVTSPMVNRTSYTYHTKHYKET